jgi:hypothetical protein
MEYFATQHGELPYQISHMFLPPMPSSNVEPFEHKNWHGADEESLIKITHDALTQFRALHSGTDAAEIRRIDRCVQALRQLTGTGLKIRAGVLWQQIADLGDNGGCYECYYFSYYLGTETLPSRLGIPHVGLG